jgi:hypothetical protein
MVVARDQPANRFAYSVDRPGDVEHQHYQQQHRDQQTGADCPIRNVRA